MKHGRKKNTDTVFDATMGGYDGAELDELIGIYIQFLLTNILSKDNMDSYIDDGFFITYYLLFTTNRWNTNENNQYFQKYRL